MSSEGFKIDVDVPKLVTIGVVSVLILVIVFTGTHAYYLKFDYEQFTSKYYEPTSPLVDEVKAKAGEQLHTFKWKDQKTNTAQVPIDQAIKIMAQSKGRPPTTQPLGPSAGAGQ
jgi:hypothetical protein